jgi:hypothetical protein
VNEVDPRLVAALTAQLGLWRAALAEGAESDGSLGWARESESARGR